MERRRRRRRGGFNPLAVHAVLQGFKPVTNGIAFAKALGVDKKISDALDSNPFGRAVKSLGNFAQKTLGYGSKSRKRTYRRRAYGARRPRRRGGALTVI